MKITTNFLSLPPHISTSWKNVTSLQVVNENGVATLAIILNDTHVVKIPGLSGDILNMIFAFHAKHLEESAQKEKQPSQNIAAPLSALISPFQLSIDGNGGIPMQHNPELANTPLLPPDVLSKISQVAKAIGGFEDASAIPPAEPHCNCMFCQVARAIRGEEVEEKTTQEIDVSDDDLKFKEFDIEQKSEQLYQVSNPLDHSECFQVFLGDPIGCTCGKKNCEHIKAVLNS